MAALTATPVGQAVGIEVALSVLGYAFVPVVIGLFVTDAVLRFTRRHTIPTDDAVENIGDKATRSMKAAPKAAAPTKAATSPPPPVQPPPPTQTSDS